MKNILWIYTKRSTFVEKDIRLVSDNFKIYEFEFLNRPKYCALLSMIKLFFHLLVNLKKYDLYVCQFAGYQSFVPSIFYYFFKKKLLIIVGGTDCVSIPKINYGNFNKKLLGWVTKFSFNHCSHITAVDETLVFQKYEYDDSIGNQGIKQFVPNIKTPISVIYNGYDSAKWHRTFEKVNNTFITVAAGSDLVTLYVKGIDIIYEVADFFPQCHFTIIGLPKGFDKFGNKKNITTLPFIQNNQLIDFYSKSEFYLQLSLTEGFPNALCEAMLCECIPIVSNVAAMPKIVGDAGFVLLKRDKKELINLIQKAIQSDKNYLSKKARERIMNNFSENNRKLEMLHLLENIMKQE